METSGTIHRGKDREFLSVASHLDFDNVEDYDFPCAVSEMPLEHGTLGIVITPEDSDNSELWTEGDIMWALSLAPTKDWPWWRGVKSFDDIDFPMSKDERKEVEEWLQRKIAELQQWFG